MVLEHDKSDPCHESHMAHTLARAHDARTEIRSRLSPSQLGATRKIVVFGLKIRGLSLKTLSALNTLSLTQTLSLGLKILGPA